MKRIIRAVTASLLLLFIASAAPPPPAGWERVAPREEIRPAFSFEPTGGPAKTGSWVIAHCGDAGWISGQALNGFNAADLHRAPVTFVMNRNGIQLSIGPEQLSRSERRVGDSGPRSTNAPGQAEQVNVRLETGRLEQNWSATDMSS